MPARVTYSSDGTVASIAMDDGKANALSLDMLGELNDALDRAEADGVVPVLSGRDGLFSAGFDLKVIQAGDGSTATMVQAGFELALRMLSFPRPVVIACTGHAIAMGGFLVLSADYRVGVAGPFKFQANEVAIGLPLPIAAIEIMRHRLNSSAFTRIALLAEPVGPDEALEMGYLDQVVDAASVRDVAHAVATTLAALNPAAHAASKLRARAGMLAAMRAGIEADAAAFISRTQSSPG